MPQAMKFAVVEWPEEYGTLRYTSQLLDTELMSLPVRICVTTTGWQAAHSIANKANVQLAMWRATGRGPKNTKQLPSSEWLSLLNRAVGEVRESFEGRVFGTGFKQGNVEVLHFETKGEG